MFTLGIDIGSTTSKCVILKDGTDIVATSLVVGGIGTGGPEEAKRQVMEAAGLQEADLAFTVATGYGRNRYEGAQLKMSELTCHGLGAHAEFPTARTIIDIGGQDVKVIALDHKGRMKNFVMNDKCAAGTGRFLDVMANILRLETAQLGDYAARAEEVVSISSTCTVFAESEVISQLANGVPIPDLVAGICDSVASRVTALVKRLGEEQDICMSGGVAQNSGVRTALERRLGVSILYSPRAQLFGAMGAALCAWQKANQ